MWLRLAVTSHSAKDHRRASIAQGQRRNERVQSALARGEGVGGSRVEREVGAAVVERDAGVVHDVATAKAAVVALDQGDGVALGVRGAQVDGVAGECAG